MYTAGQGMGTSYNQGLASQSGKTYDTSWAMGDTTVQGVDAGLQGLPGVASEAGYNYNSALSQISTDASAYSTDIGNNTLEGFTTAAEEIEAPMNQMRSTVEETFIQMEEAVNKSVNKIVNAVDMMVSKLLDSVNFQWSLPYLKIPHLSVSGRFNTNPPSVPVYRIAWYARGGVFDTPTLFSHNGSIGGLGENGAEAIVPLENNTEWLDRIAERLGAGSSRPIVLQVDGKTFAETSVDSINALTRQTGKLGLVLV